MVGVKPSWRRHLGRAAAAQARMTCGDRATQARVIENRPAEMGERGNVAGVLSNIAR